MALHILKLCVGADSVDDLRAFIDARLAHQRALGMAAEQVHTTRMIPKRRDELLDGGSLYWVIKGQVQVRQRLLDIRPFVDGEGISRCHLVLEPALQLTQWQPRRPFQGWRYLHAKDAPRDVGEDASVDDLPPEMRQELTSLGLL